MRAQESANLLAHDYIGADAGLSCAGGTDVTRESADIILLASHLGVLAALPAPGVSPDCSQQSNL